MAREATRHSANAPRPFLLVIAMLLLQNSMVCLDVIHFPDAGSMLSQRRRLDGGLTLEQHQGSVLRVCWVGMSI